MSQLVPWNPMYDIVKWRGGIDDIFRDMISEVAGPDSREMLSGKWVPAVDIDENDQEFLVKADLPGMAEKDVTVTLENNILSLRGERKHETKSTNGGQRRVERSYGSFVRSFMLPSTGDAEHAKATFKDGVLTVSVPKKTEAKPKGIPIKAG